MFKLQNTKQTYRTKARQQMPVTIGRKNEDLYAKELIGYRVSDQNKLRKMNGYRVRTIIPNTRFVKAVQWGDKVVVFYGHKDGVNSFINVGVFTEDLSGEMYKIFTNLSYTSRSDVLEDNFDAVPFGEYLILQVGGVLYMHSKDTNFIRFNYASPVTNNVVLDDILMSADGMARGKIVSKSLGAKGEVFLSDVQGEFRVGQTVTDEHSNSYVVRGIGSSNDYLPVYLTISNALTVGATVTSASATGIIKRIVDTYDRSTYNGYQENGGRDGIIEFTTNNPKPFLYDEYANGGTIRVSGEAVKTIQMYHAPVGLSLSVFKYGGFSSLAVGNIVDGSAFSLEKGQGLVYYSQGWYNDGTIPFYSFKSNYQSNVNSAGVYSHQSYGGVKNIITHDDFFYTLYDKGVIATRITPLNRNDSVYNFQDHFWNRDEIIYDIATSAKGSYYIAKDGLYSINISNASGKFDVNISKVLGDRMKEYDFKYSKLKIYGDKIYILCNKCQNNEELKNTIIVYDTELNTWSEMVNVNIYNFIEGDTYRYVYGLCFEEIKEVGHDTSYGYGNDNMPTLIETNEFIRDRDFYINNIFLTPIGSSSDSITVSVLGRIDGELQTLATEEFEFTKSNGQYFSSPICSTNRGNKDFFRIKLNCHKPVSGLIIRISSNNNSCHELDNFIEIDYTLTKHRICQ